jgi:hypothetical protein
MAGMVCYGCFIAAQLHPRSWTVYPAALLGLGRVVALHYRSFTLYQIH